MVARSVASACYWPDLAVRNSCFSNRRRNGRNLCQSSGPFVVPDGLLRRNTAGRGQRSSRKPRSWRIWGRRPHRIMRQFRNYFNLLGRFMNLLQKKSTFRVDRENGPRLYTPHTRRRCLMAAAGYTFPVLSGTASPDSGQAETFAG